MINMMFLIQPNGKLMLQLVTKPSSLSLNGDAAMSLTTMRLIIMVHASYSHLSSTIREITLGLMSNIPTPMKILGKKMFQPATLPSNSMASPAETTLENALEKSGIRETTPSPRTNSMPQTTMHTRPMPQGMVTTKLPPTRMILSSRLRLIQLETALLGSNHTLFVITPGTSMNTITPTKKHGRPIPQASITIPMLELHP